MAGVSGVKARDVSATTSPEDRARTTRTWSNVTPGNTPRCDSTFDAAAENVGANVMWARPCALRPSAAAGESVQVAAPKHARKAAIIRGARSWDTVCERETAIATSA